MNTLFKQIVVVYLGCVSVLIGSQPLGASVMTISFNQDTGVENELFLS